MARGEGYSSRQRKQLTQRNRGRRHREYLVNDARSVFRARSAGRGWRVMVDPARKARRLIPRSLDSALSARETAWPHHVCRDPDLSEAGVGGEVEAGETKAEEAQPSRLERGFQRRLGLLPGLRQHTWRWGWRRKKAVSKPFLLPQRTGS